MSVRTKRSRRWGSLVGHQSPGATLQGQDTRPRCQRANAHALPEMPSPGSGRAAAEV